MKWVLALFVAAAPLAAAASPLPGVSDHETDIHSGQLEDFQLGHGDVAFVRDRTNRWYRLEFNPGCLSQAYGARSMSIRFPPGAWRVTRYMTAEIDNGMVLCQIRSIRRSAAPPQIDSKSRVTLD